MVERMPAPQGNASVHPGSSEKRGVKYLLGPCATVFESTATGSWRLVRPVVDSATCTRCGICSKHCPADVMDVPVGNKSKEVFIDMRFCKGCGICADVCARKCISMVPEKGGR